MFRIGQVSLRPHLAEHYLYSDELRVRPGLSRSTHINRFTAGLLAEFGNDWSLNYSNTWVRYTDPSFADSTDLALNLDGAIRQHAWSAEISSHNSANSDVLVETARQTRRKLSNTDVQVFVPLGGPFSADAQLSQNLNFLERLSDWHEWALTPSLHYVYSPKVNLSLGTAAGYVLIYDSADMAYVRPQASAAWKISTKLVANALFGLEERKLVGGRRTWLETPIVEAAVVYLPASNTTLAVRTSRRVSPAYVQQQSVDARSWTFVFSQRFLRHFDFQAEAGVRKADYLPSAAISTVSRSDKYRNVNVSLGTRILRYGRLSGFYSRSRNESNTPGFDFVNNQVGVRIETQF